MKNTIYFIAGILFTALISATTISVMKFEPAKPKSVICFNEYQEFHTVQNIKKYVSKGYILKSCNGGSNGGWIIIMEKY